MLSPGFVAIAGGWYIPQENGTENFLVTSSKPDQGDWLFGEDRWSGGIGPIRKAGADYLGFDGPYIFPHATPTRLSDVPTL